MPQTAPPKPRGGSISALEEVAAKVLALIAEQPDLTLVETVAELRRRRVRTSRSSLWRFLDRHDITLKKKPASRGTAAGGCGPRAATLDAGAGHA
jgi:transposase